MRVVGPGITKLLLRVNGVPVQFGWATSGERSRESCFAWCGMELFDAFTTDHDCRSQIPNEWRLVGSLAAYATLADIEAAIGRLDEESDVVIGALLAMPLHDPMVAPVLLAGLRRLIFLCRGRDRRLLDDLVTEVAISIGEFRRARPVGSRRRLGYVIVDRGRDRQRASLRREMACRSIDPLTVAESVPAAIPLVEESVIDRLRVGVLREQVAASGDQSLARSWNSLVELVDEPRLSQAERDRWKYIRRRLAGYLSPDAA